MSDKDFDNELNKHLRFNRLYDIYGKLLTDKQRNIMEQYFYDDLSLGEIAEHSVTSRQAVYDLLKRVEQILENYEDKLQILATTEKQRWNLKKGKQLLHACMQDGNNDKRLTMLATLLEEMDNEGR